VQLHQVANERQAESEPGVAPRRPAVGLLESLEHVGQHVGSDALPAIADGDLDVRAHPMQLDLDAAFPRGELHRVDEQVPDDLLEPVRVAGDPERAGIEHGLQPEALGLGGRAHRIERRVHHRPEVDRAQVEPHLAGDDARDVQHVVDQLDLGVGVAHDDVERALRRLARPPPPGACAPSRRPR
jgi:hypothetical protein